METAPNETGQLPVSRREPNLPQCINIIGFDIYLALGNIALVFAAQVCRDSEITDISNAGTPIGQLLLRYPFANHSLDSAVYGIFW